MAQQGMDAEAIAAELTKLQSRVDASFVLQTLEYLKKGGRCSSVVALGANLLSLRPEIEVTGGKMQVGKKYRGKMEKSILDYVRGRLQGREDIETKRPENSLSTPLVGSICRTVYVLAKRPLFSSVSICA